MRRRPSVGLCAGFANRTSVELAGNALLQALRADNWLHAYGDPNGPEATAIRQQMTNAFYVDDDEWRGMVLGQALAASRAALTGLICLEIVAE